MSSNACTTPLSVPPARTGPENQFRRHFGTEEHLPRPPLRIQTNDTNNVYHHTNHPSGFPFSAPLPPMRTQAAQEFNVWNTQDRSPPQPLQGPGHIGPPPPPLPDRPPPSTVPHKRKRVRTINTAAVGGYGPILDGLDGERTEPSTPDSSPTIKFVERKNSAYEIWAFTRAAETGEDVPAVDWPDDYGNHLTKRPDATFISCKFCTEFG